MREPPQEILNGWLDHMAREMLWTCPVPARLVQFAHDLETHCAGDPSTDSGGGRAIRAPAMPALQSYLFEGPLQ